MEAAGGWRRGCPASTLVTWRMTRVRKLAVNIRLSSTNGGEVIQMALTDCLPVKPLFLTDFLDINYSWMYPSTHIGRLHHSLFEYSVSCIDFSVSLGQIQALSCCSKACCNIPLRSTQQSDGASMDWFIACLTNSVYKWVNIVSLSCQTNSTKTLLFYLERLGFLRNTTLWIINVLEICLCESTIFS